MPKEKVKKKKNLKKMEVKNSRSEGFGILIITHFLFLIIYKYMFFVVGVVG